MLLPWCNLLFWSAYIKDTGILIFPACVPHLFVSNNESDWNWKVFSVSQEGEANSCPYDNEGYSKEVMKSECINPWAHCVAYRDGTISREHQQDPLFPHDSFSLNCKFWLENPFKSQSGLPVLFKPDTFHRYIRAGLHPKENIIATCRV